MYLHVHKSTCVCRGFVLLGHYFATWWLVDIQPLEFYARLLTFPTTPRIQPPSRRKMEGTSYRRRHGGGQVAPPLRRGAAYMKCRSCRPLTCRFYSRWDSSHVHSLSLVAGRSGQLVLCTGNKTQCPPCRRIHAPPIHSKRRPGYYRTIEPRSHLHNTNWGRVPPSRAGAASRHRVFGYGYI